MAQRVRGHVFVDSGASRSTPDDVGEDRLLQPPPGEAAEDRVGRLGLSRLADAPELSCETGRHRLTPRLSALAAADEQRSLSSVEVEITPLEGAELGAAKAGRHEREQDEPVSLGEARQVPLWVGGDASSSLRNSSGVSQSRSWRGFGGGSRSRNGSGTPSRLLTQRRKRRRRRKRR